MMEYSESIHEALYTLEYHLIPSYLNDDYSYYLESVESIHDGACWNDLFEDESWKNIDFQKMQLLHFSSYPLSYVVIKFPDPMEEPLAYIGMVVKWMGEYRYFTLEKGRGANFLCEVAAKMCNGLGQIPSPVPAPTRWKPSTKRGGRLIRMKTGPRLPSITKRLLSVDIQKPWRLLASFISLAG